MLDYGTTGAPKPTKAFFGGTRFMWRTDSTNYFLHTMVSYNRLRGSGSLDPTTALARCSAAVSIFPSKRLSIRVFEADYVWARHNYSDIVGPRFPDLRRVTLDGARLTGGLCGTSAMLRRQRLRPVLCPAQEVMVGEPITATATGTNFNPKHTLKYHLDCQRRQGHWQGHHRQHRHQRSAGGSTR